MGSSVTQFKVPEGSQKRVCMNFQRAKSKESVHELQLLKRKERRDEAELNGIVLLTMLNRLTGTCKAPES